MRSHLDALQAMALVDFRQGRGDSHSVAQQASFYIAFETNFQGFGSPTGLPTSTFQAFCSTLFFNAFENQISLDFWKLRTRKITIFLMIFAKRAFSIKLRNYLFCLYFRRSKRRKSIQKSNPKTCCF